MQLVYKLSTHYAATPITDSLTIAEVAQVSHATIKYHIRNHPEEFLICRRYPLWSRPVYDVAGQPYYYLNEEHVAALFSHLQNTAANRELEMEINRQFGEMKFELYLRQKQRKNSINARKDCIDLARSNEMSTTKIADLAFQVAFNKNIQSYRSDAGIFYGARTVDYMSYQDLVKLTEAQHDIATMIRAGCDYESMKLKVLSQTTSETNPSSETQHRSQRGTIWSFLAKKLRPLLQMK